MQSNPDRYNWQSVLLFAILLIGLALYLGLAGLMLISGGLELVSTSIRNGLEFRYQFHHCQWVGVLRACHASGSLL